MDISHKIKKCKAKGQVLNLGTKKCLSIDKRRGVAGTKKQVESYIMTFKKRAPIPLSSLPGVALEQIIKDPKINIFALENLAEADPGIKKKIDFDTIAKEKLLKWLRVKRIKITKSRKLEIGEDKKLKTIPKSIGYLTDLNELSIIGNKLKEIPESIGCLTNLQVLNLGHNQLISVPESIGSLINLQRLDLSNNQLTTLPKSIGKLINLQELEVGSNQLLSIPESIGSLINLEYLDLSYNELTSVPESIGSLINIKDINANYNPLNKKSWKLVLKMLEYRGKR